MTLAIIIFTVGLLSFSIGRKYGYKSALDDMIPTAADIAIVTTIEKLEKIAVKMGYDNILNEIISATFVEEELRRAKERVKAIN